MNYTRTKILVATALFVCCLIALLTLQNHVLFYQEQHTLFLFTGDYFHSRPLLDWLSDFVVQFYHIPWLGATITSLLLTAVYFLTEGIIGRLTGLRDWLQLGVIGAVGLYFTFDGVDETPRMLIGALLALLLMWLLSVAAGRFLPIFRPRRALFKKHFSIFGLQLSIPFIISIVLTAAYIYGGLLWEMHDYNRPERAMVRADRAVKAKDWDEVLAITDKYLSTGRTNRLMLYFRNIALAEKGVLLEHMFDFPLRPGVSALVFPWKGDSRDSEYGHLVHEVTGNLNAAHHWAFESMTSWGETAPHLLDLARYNIAMGRPRVAQKFVDRLSHSLFYRDDAETLQRQIDGVEPPELHYAWSGKQEEKTRFINVYNPLRDLMEIVNADPDNHIARQYLKAVLLAANDQDALVTVLDKGATDPSAIEEAKLIYSLYPQSTPLDTLGLTLTQEVRDRFARFRALRSRPIEMEPQFGKSFWYYIYNYCPTGPDKRNSLPSDTIIPGAALKH